MSQSPYVTVREAAQLLGVADARIMQLIEQKKLFAYRIADQYLRLKRSDIQSLKLSGDVQSETVKFPYTPQERLADFLRFNDFYIVAFVLVAVLLGVIFYFH